MSVEARLARLRPGSQQSSTVQGGLAARIDRLRVTARNRSPASDGELLLRTALSGEEIAAGVLLIERRTPAGAPHGRQRLEAIGDCIEVLPEALGVDAQKLLFLDTETTGLCGGSGTLAFLVGVARLERGDFICRQYLLTRFAGEAAMLAALADWCGAEQVLVSYNGKSFDLPLLAARFRMAGAANPLVNFRHIDLVHTVRRAFSRCWEDCRLATAEQRLLGVHRYDDLPGAEAPAAWFDWLRQGDQSRLPLVCRHNHSDLLSLALLLPRLVQVYRHPQLHGADHAAVIRAYAKHGRDHPASALLREAAHRRATAADHLPVDSATAG